MRNIKKLVAVVLTGVMVMGSAMSALAYSSDAMKSITNATLKKYSFDKDWIVEDKEIIPTFMGEELLGVEITCGFDSRWLLSDKDYVKNVGGSSSEYSACGYVANDGSWDYTSWTKSSKNSGTAKVTHSKDYVVYGVKIAYGE